MAPPESEKEVYALFYLVHTSIEAAMDIVAMLVKDIGGVPKDDYENKLNTELNLIPQNRSQAAYRL